MVGGLTPNTTGVTFNQATRQRSLKHKRVHKCEKNFSSGDYVRIRPRNAAQETEHYNKCHFNIHG